MAPPHTPAAPRNTIETYSSRPDREPPRNEKGEIICTHEACIGKSELFRRPCEWNKHMDKHERPYKCNEPTCEQNPGFTYSGGLLRHMREVHKKGVGPSRRPLFCPHANCIRSTGEGFTRRENLEEHLRRRHSHNGPYVLPETSDDGKQEAGDENGERALKRRRTEDPVSPLNETQMSAQSRITSGPVQYANEVEAQAARDALNNTDPSLLEQTQLNSEFADLDQSEANQQLRLARQYIAEQQEVIRQQQMRIYDQDQELYRLRGPDPRHDNNNINGNAYTTNQIASPVQQPTNTNGNAISNVAQAAQAAYAAQQHQEIPLAPELTQATNGYMPHSRAENAVDDTERQVTPAQRSENSSEPSRRIEIARDLVTEKAQQAQ
ncbi:hypothetical protein LTR66_014335, partial [Elasticomyces elasticus]